MRTLSHSNRSSFIAFSLACLTLTSCQSTNPLSGPSGDSQQAFAASPSFLREPQSTSDVETWVGRVQALSESKELTAQTCAVQITPFLAQLYKLDPAVLDWDHANKDQIKKDSTRWLQTLFNSRMKMRSRIPELATGPSQAACVKSIRRFLVYVRFAEEVLSETMVRFKVYPDQDADGEESAWRGAFPATLVNPAYGKLEFKSGDLLLDRGDSALSAQIARIGDVEHVFSHAMIIGEDKQGKLYVVETTVQDIVGIRKLQDYWDENADARMALFRQKDPELAHRAGRFIYDYVQSHKDSIKYDFHMNDKDPSEMFCAEVGQYAYFNASKGTLSIPMFKTDLSRFDVMGQDNWIRQMGIDQRAVYSPGDIDVDPRFTEVAEYRYIKDLRDRRLDDAVMTSMYNWMLDKGYHFSADAADSILSNVGTLAAKLFGGFHDITDNMPAGAVKASLEFERVFDFIRKGLDVQEKAYLKERGHSMSFAQMLVLNEQFRQRDCRLYQTARNAARGDTPPDLSPYMHTAFESLKACPPQQ